jgi:hypothetical protein
MGPMEVAAFLVLSLRRQRVATGVAERTEQLSQAEASPWRAERNG